MTTTTPAPKLTATQEKALRYFAAPAAERTGRFPHGATINSLTDRGLLERDSTPDAAWWSRQITDAGRTAVGIPTDQELLVAYMEADAAAAGDDWKAAAEAMDVLVPAAVARFGPDALEHLASWCTGIHAAPEDMVALARDNWDRCQEIMRGDYDWA